jgi:nucleotide-binding universal stress UspA family protein
MNSRNPIVVGTDGSAGAQRAVDRAGDLAQALQADVHVLCSYPSASPGPWMAAAGGLAIAEAASTANAQERAEEIVARAAERLNRRGIPSRTHVCGGDPAASLITIAADVHAQMIVVGNRGMSGARRVLGSVPNSVSHHARCSVLIVETS